VIWVGLVAGVVGAALGFVGGLGVRRLDAIAWKRQAVDMARMNADLMDRMDLLEAERQKEG
jgi:uncharacterized membrane protein